MATESAAAKSAEAPRSRLPPVRGESFTGFVRWWITTTATP
jgi:hypothetical protein